MGGRRLETLLGWVLHMASQTDWNERCTVETMIGGLFSISPPAVWADFNGKLLIFLTPRLSSGTLCISVGGVGIWSSKMPVRAIWRSQSG